MKQTTSLLTQCRLISLLLLLYASMAGQELTHVPGSILLKPQPHVAFQHFSSELNNCIATPFNLTIVCSEPFPIWMIQADAAVENEYLLLEVIREMPSIEMAQFNHFISDRLLPNDPQFSNQWHYINTGINGGMINADLDAELAWDFTTGGLTESGDTIVICMIDEGLDAVHPDLSGNLWYNHSEIPNNNIDDDWNGYVDDYNGWNTTNATDQLNSGPNAGWHGTPVAGIIGAKGNNDIGVTGVNWNTKIMTVVRGATEAQTLAAYAYPYSFRKKYNDTNGQEGAFVVATNSSWGVDFGQPDDVPLWCAFYDSLGTVGILNAAATVNANYDVDLYGDLPTACPSDYLISVTNLNSNDQKNINAGYGALSIDLGAYGTNIWTIKKNNSYGNFTGTSAAAPLVGGAIALLYAAPCPDISWYAKNDPATTALLIKSYIMNGTTAVPGLEYNTVSGGRLNLNGALNQVMNACAYASCFPPTQISTTVVQNTSVTIDWLNATNNSITTLRYKQVGASNWIVIPDVNAAFMLSGLSGCANYEYQLKSQCGTDESAYSGSYYFKTDGCCEAPVNFVTESVSPSSALISWPGSSAALNYSVLYRPAGGLTWTELNSSISEILILDLNACTEYELKVKVQCANGTITDFSQPYWWKTSACDNCLENTYCTVSIVDNPLTWISLVSLSDLDHTSGSSLNGYSDFTGISATLISGLFYNLTIETDYEIVESPMYFQVWIDFNQNGDFEYGEILLQSSDPSNSCSAIINIPSNALTGTTRMRIAARTELLSACGVGGMSGEVEDYCITIVENSACLPPQGVNSVQGVDQTTVSWIENSWSDQFTIFYRELNAVDWISVTTTSSLVSIENLNSCTDYEYKVRAGCNGEHSLFTPLLQFTTLGCGSCLDLDYCIPDPGITSFEWISRFSLNEIDQISDKEGYGDFTGNSTNLIKGALYYLHIEPGFSGNAYEEFYTVWIDFNQDGSFDDLSEKVYNSLFASTDEIIVGACFIPLTALEGATRLRVSMKYYTELTSGCEGGFFGEVEDYCVTILADANDMGCSKPSDISLQMVNDTSAAFSWNGPADAVSYQFRYRSADIISGSWKVATNPSPYCLANNLMVCTDYEYQVRTICENGLSQYSTSAFFTTDCFSVDTESDEQKASLFAFPNPFQDYLWVQTQPGFRKEWQVELFNISGQLLLSSQQVTLEDGLIGLETQNLPAGLYLLRLDNGKEAEVLKVVK